MAKPFPAIQTKIWKETERERERAESETEEKRMRGQRVVPKEPRAAGHAELARYDREETEYRAERVEGGHAAKGMQHEKTH